MSLPDQTILCRGDAFFDGLGGDPSYYAQDHTELQLSYQSNQGPMATSDTMLDGYRHKIEWTRFEVQCLEQCGDNYELAGYIGSLLLTGKHDGRTRDKIVEAIRLQHATTQRLDDFEVVEMVTFLRGI